MYSKVRFFSALSAALFTLAVATQAKAAEPCAEPIKFAAAMVAKAHLAHDGGRVFVMTSEPVEAPEYRGVGTSVYRLGVQMPGQSQQYLVTVNRRTCQVVGVALEK